MLPLWIAFAEIETCGGPCVGDRRVDQKFLWFPKKIDGEWRFLEKVAIMSEYVQIDKYPYTCFWQEKEWRNVK